MTSASCLAKRAPRKDRATRTERTHHCGLLRDFRSRPSRRHRRQRGANTRWHDAPPARRDRVRRGSVLDHCVVRIAVQPALPRLRRGDHRMSGGVGMFAGMLVRRTIAAARPATGLAGAEVDPGRADLHAFLALAALRPCDSPNGLEMRTDFCAHRRLSYSLRTRWTNEIATDPSPTADATLLMLPPRTSPTAKTPGRLVSRR